MPVATQSLVPYNQTIFTAVDGTTYKTQIDADTAIASNVVGMLYVYPNSPAGMSVLVDDAYNIQQVSSTNPILLNGGSSPNVVSVSAPGSNSYYATIFWNFSTSVPGVVFGASGVSPVPVLPDNWIQIPLALVLISSVTTSITAANIQDVRQWAVFKPATVSLGSVGTNQTVNCQYATSVKIVLSISASLSLIMTNLRVGTHVSISVTNPTGGTLTFKILASAPSATSIPVNGKTAGTSTGFHDIGTAGTGFVMATATSLIIEGEIGLSSLDVIAS